VKKHDETSHSAFRRNHHPLAKLNGRSRFADSTMSNERDDVAQTKICSICGTVFIADGLRTGRANGFQLSRSGFALGGE
jgi:hypothetical protein